MGRRDNQQRSGGLIGKLASGGTFLYGLSQEINAGQKARKSAAATAGGQVSGRSTPEGSSQYGRSTPQIQYPETSRGDAPPPSYDAVVGDSKSDLEIGSLSLDEKKRDVSPSVSPRTSLSLQPSNANIQIRPLPCPVILPQRRPNNKSRGFIRAYAPDLGRYKGIGQTEFLQFLKEFHKQSQASPIFGVINVAAMGAGFAPGMIAFAVSASVQAAATTSANFHERYKTNSYLDQANEKIFHPKNLHAMIMTFKPDDDNNTLLDVDGNSNSTMGSSRGGGPLSLLASAGSAALSKSRSSNTSGQSQSKFRSIGSDGTTQGSLSLPQAAELVFPDPSAVSAQNSDGSEDARGDQSSSSAVSQEKKPAGAWKTASKSMAEYMDRRAQAKFAMQNGANSGLAVPGATDSTRFVSKYSDPSYVNPLSGGLGALRGDGRGQQQQQGRGGLNNGRRTRDQRSRRRSRDDRRYRGGDRGAHGYPDYDDDDDYYDHDGRRSMGYPQNAPAPHAPYGGQEYYGGDDRDYQYQDRRNQRQQQQSGGGRKKGRILGKVMAQDVLYLMIAEMPSKEEMDDLMDQAGQHQQQQQGVYSQPGYGGGGGNFTDPPAQQQQQQQQQGLYGPPSYDVREQRGGENRYGGSSQSHWQDYEPRQESWEGYGDRKEKS